MDVFDTVVIPSAGFTEIQMFTQPQGQGQTAVRGRCQAHQATGHRRVQPPAGDHDEVRRADRECAGNHRGRQQEPGDEDAGG